MKLLILACSFILLFLTDLWGNGEDQIDIESLLGPADSVVWKDAVRRERLLLKEISQCFGMASEYQKKNAWSEFIREVNNRYKGRSICDLDYCSFLFAVNADSVLTERLDGELVFVFTNSYAYEQHQGLHRTAIHVVHDKKNTITRIVIGQSVE